MENTKIDILDHINVETPETPLNVVGGVSTDATNITKQSTADGDSGKFGFITKYMTKKNVYILCGVIIVAGLIYYFYIKKSKKFTKANKDINVELPANATHPNFYIPLPQEQNSQQNSQQMSQDEYNKLIYQQMLAQQGQQEQQGQQRMQGMQGMQGMQQDIQEMQGQHNPDSTISTLPQVIHPGQNIQDNIDDETDDIETPVLDNQKLTAEEIKQISEQLEKMQSNGSN